jgi:hypothetical protein
MKKFFKKIGKGIKKGVKKIGKALKTGMRSVSKALGPVGTLALSLMLPGIGAAWAGFTGAAATATGALGTVMRGIAAAGNAVGTVYSSVTGMLGSVVKAIPGVGDMYTRLSNFTTDMMDRGRMALGLPTSGATTAANTAKVGNDMSVELEPMKVDTKALKQKNLLDVDTDFKVTMKDTGGTFIEGAEMGSVPVDYGLPTPDSTLGGVTRIDATGQSLQTKMANLQQSDWDALGIDKNVNREFTDIEMAKINDYQPTNIAQSKPLDYTKDLVKPEQYTPKSQFVIEAGKASPAKVISSEDFLAQQSLEDPTGFTQVRSNIKVNNRAVGEIDVDELTYDTYDVKTADLTSDQIKQINKTNSEIDYFNNQRDRIVSAATLEDGTINPEFNELDRTMVGLKRGAALAAGAETLLNTATMEEEPIGGSGNIAPMLAYNIESPTDYSQAYASAFQSAGYVGANDFNSYANAGYYGGDPFSIAQYNRVRAPQPTIRLGG